MKSSPSLMNARGQGHSVTLARSLEIKKMIKIWSPFCFFSKQKQQALGLMKMYFI